MSSHPSDNDVQLVGGNRRQGEAEHEEQVEAVVGEVATLTQSQSQETAIKNNNEPNSPQRPSTAAATAAETAAAVGEGHQRSHTVPHGQSPRRPEEKQEAASPIRPPPIYAEAAAVKRSKRPARPAGPGRTGNHTNGSLDSSFNDDEDDSVVGDWSIADQNSTDDDGDHAPLHLTDDDDDDDNDRKLPADPKRSDRNRSRSTSDASMGSTSFIMSAADIALAKRLDMEFDRALEEREIAYSARFYSVRQSAFFSIVFMSIFLTLGTIFFLKQSDWKVSDSILFSIYTITTVGYGHLEHPQTATFQLYTIFFIFIGIATMTIVVAQVYQWFALEASRAQHSRDQSELTRLGMETISRSQVEAAAASADPSSGQQTDSDGGNGADGENGPTRRAPPRHSSNESIIIESPPPTRQAQIIEFLWRTFLRCHRFFTTHEIGRSISVIFPFLGLILIGAVVIGPIEGWSAVESLYFSVVSLTTLGYGDYFPSREASIWFCILWLPFSVGFMSLFLANVAAFYIRLSDKNIERIEGQLRRQVAKQKQRAEEERRAARQRALRGQRPFPGSEGGAESDDDDQQYAIELGTLRQQEEARRRKAAAERRGPAGFDTVPSSEDDLEEDDEEQGVVPITSEHGRRRGGRRSSRSRPLFGSKRSPKNRREVIQINHSQAGSLSPVPQSGSDTAQSDTRPRESTMSTMRDVLRAVRMNLAQEGSIAGSSFPSAGPESQFLSIRSSQTVRKTLESHSIRKPSFALRALVQERFSEIIATDIAGYSSNIEISENTLSISIDSLKQTADKWLVPRRARRAFRAVAFEAIVFVGEHGLVTRGADALYDLSPFEFHGLFAPLLAAMGDAETMEGWLSSTQVLAEVDLGRDTRKWAAERPLEASPLSSKRGGKVRITPGAAFAAAKGSVQFG